MQINFELVKFTKYFGNYRREIVSTKLCKAGQKLSLTSEFNEVGFFPRGSGWSEATPRLMIEKDNLGKIGEIAWRFSVSDPIFR